MEGESESGNVSESGNGMVWHMCVEIDRVW